MARSDIEQLEANMQASRNAVATGKALERLMGNADFKEIILKGYLEEEAVRLVHLKADYQMRAPDRQADIVRQIDAIGALKGYFLFIHQMWNLAEQTQASDEQTYAEILAEELQS